MTAEPDLSVDALAALLADDALPEHLARAVAQVTADVLNPDGEVVARFDSAI